ncbi:MAG TPA: energy transducer TonB [Candidatus Aquilonibacter sp.]|nr:energy transducer TonB [Candidatus Aquilonibacter sp.]
MRRILAALVSAQPPQTHYPKHIEMPSYPRAAELAMISGKVALAVFVNESGRAVDARVNASASTVSPLTSLYLLSADAIANIQKWTLTPSSSRYSIEITYDYELLSVQPCGPSTEKVTVDLPDSITIYAAPVCAETDISKPQ